MAFIRSWTRARPARRPCFMSSMRISRASYLSLLTSHIWRINPSKYSRLPGPRRPFFMCKLVVITVARYFQYLTHLLHKILIAMGINDLIFYHWYSLKMGTVFFSMPHSMRIPASSRLRRVTYSSLDWPFPLPGKLFSSVAANSLR